MTATDRVRVEARGELVELAIGTTIVTMTPREAQRFAYYLARAYSRAGHAHQGRGPRGNLVLAAEEATHGS